MGDDLTRFAAALLGPVRSAQLLSRSTTVSKGWACVFNAIRQGPIRSASSRAGMATTLLATGKPHHGAGPVEESSLVRVGQTGPDTRRRHRGVMALVLTKKRRIGET
jgi:hypothetical protein